MGLQNSEWGRNRRRVGCYRKYRVIGRRVFNKRLQYQKQMNSAEKMMGVHRRGMGHKQKMVYHCHSFSHLQNTPVLALDFKELFLRKSLFAPPEGLAQSFAARRHIPAADVPIVEVIHYSKRWLLLQAPRFSRSFFRRINSGSLGNPYDQLLKIFKSFAALTRLFGFFRPTVGMIFMEGKRVCAWISEDVFSNTCDMPLGEEREFVIAFLAMVEGQLSDWERVNRVETIEEMTAMLEWRSQLARGSQTAVRASKEVWYQPNQSKLSFDPRELGTSRRLNACRSVQDLSQGNASQFLQTELSSSVTIKQFEVKQRVPNVKKISGLFSDSKDLKASFNDSPNQIRVTKKKFNLTSTSSTLQRFSQKWRSTAGRKTKKNIQTPDKLASSHDQAPPSPILHASNPLQTFSIQNQIEDLFSDQKGSHTFGLEGNREQLQKITEQIQQVLLW